MKKFPVTVINVMHLLNCDPFGRSNISISPFDRVFLCVWGWGLNNLDFKGAGFLGLIGSWHTGILDRIYHLTRNCNLALYMKIS